MPLYNYKCLGCEIIVEVFQQNLKNVPEMQCKECGSSELKRLLAVPKNRTQLGARDNLHEKILPDADRIRKEIESGKDSSFLDVYGDK